MKECHIIRVYILTDKQGEWWETLKTDGTLRRFIPGTGEYAKDKEFKDPDKARKHAESLEIKRFKVVKLTPPVRPSRTWGEEIVYETPA